MKRLIKLLLDNRAAEKRYSIQSAGEEATIFIYDAIGDFFGVEAQQFAKDIAAIQAPLITLRINSPGGDAFDGRAISTAISQHPARVIAKIDALAASAATYVALAADEVEIAQGGFFMIHNAWTMMMGSASELRDTASLLDKVDDSIIADYLAKTGKDEEQIRAWMAKETWFSAEEAVENGFVDRIFEGKRTENRWNLAAYTNAPAALTRPKQSPQYDRATLERRLALLERVA